jgi:type IV pilus assembly protein PilN
MRLDINLATRPYEDSRQFWLRWGSGLGILGLATIILIFTALSGWYNARLDRQKISDLRAKIAERDKEKTDAEAILNRAENRSIRDRSQYLNALITRKAFSWTRALQDLERVMPSRLHVVSIKPELNEDNQLALKMVVAGDSRDQALELVKRMEESKTFRQTEIYSETQSAQERGDSVKFDISALYVPAHEPRSTR